MSRIINDSEKDTIIVNSLQVKNEVVTGGSTVKGNESIGGNLLVLGTTSLHGDVGLDGSLGAIGTATIGGNSYLNGNVFAQANASVGGNLAVTGNTNTNTFTATGNATVQGNLYSQGNTRFGATGKSISWLGYGVTPSTLALAPGTAGNYVVAFSPPAPTATNLVVLANAVSGVNADVLTYSAYNITTAGFTLACNNPSSIVSVTGITFQWIAMVIA